MKHRISPIAIAYGIIIVAGLVRIAKTGKEGHITRIQIEKEGELDIQAIHNAGEVLNKLIEAGEIRSIEQLREHFDNEIAFQKIVVRED